MSLNKYFPKGRFLLLIVSTLLSPCSSFAQAINSDTGVMQQKDMPALEIISPRTITLHDYRATATHINDLVNTRLAVRFDFQKCYLYGKEWVTLTPHFYPTDSLTLDAKGMDIHQVAIVKGDNRKPLKYHYDGMQIHILLDKTYTRQEKFELYIDYTSKPNEFVKNHSGGSAAITDNKGLYFINPHHTNPYMPTEIWTQGETEHNSVWFPTIDKPNQKTMEEISMTVPDSMTTLSNGTLISQKKNSDGSRTDTWKMEHPNSPYLFMMAAGPFVIVKDHWKNIPVNYYVEKKYAPFAKAIFGHTPEMIDFYSKILGVPYAWTKYDQVVGRDYVSGAMENTTATLHGEFMYKTGRQLQDTDYYNESVIAHELFHQWFGDLVTCESWSNITLNESFANFSEMLWAEHKYGKDLADQHSYEAMQQYLDLAKSGKDHPLVYFYYKNKEDVYDQVAYQKGGRILNMLRNYVGDSAFFHSLHYYLKQYKFQPAEAQDLRLAFEHITGKDLNWFWNQWYYGDGYPKLDISYAYNDALHLINVVIKQTQEGRLFELPFSIDIYAGDKKERHKVIMMDRVDTFTYHYKTKPELINVDGDKIFLAEKNDHKTIHNFIYQYHHAGLYRDRFEAIQACAKAQDSSEAATGLLKDALGDKFYDIRIQAIKALDLMNDRILQTTGPILKGMIKNDPRSSVRSAALTKLTYEDPSSYENIILQAIRDSSLLVENTALNLLVEINPDAAYQQAKLLQKNAEAPLTQVVCEVLAKRQSPADFAYIEKNFRENGSFGKFGYLRPYLYMLGHVITDDQVVKKGLDEIKNYAESIGPQYGIYVMGMLNDFVKAKQNAVNNTTNELDKHTFKGQAEYANQLIELLQEKLTE